MNRKVGSCLSGADWWDAAFGDTADKPALLDAFASALGRGAGGRGCVDSTCWDISQLFDDGIDADDRGGSMRVVRRLYVTNWADLPVGNPSLSPGAGYCVRPKGAGHGNAPAGTRAGELSSAHRLLRRDVELMPDWARITLSRSRCDCGKPQRRAVAFTLSTATFASEGTAAVAAELRFSGAPLRLWFGRMSTERINEDIKRLVDHYQKGRWVRIARREIRPNPKERQVVDP